MKKYFKSVLLSLMLMTLSVGLLMACNKNDNSKVIGLQVEISNTSLEYSNKTVTIQYNGSATPVTDEDFEVKIIKKDGSTAIIRRKTETNKNGYTYSTTYTDDPANVGEYTLTFGYPDVTSIEIKVNVTKTDYDTSWLRWDYYTPYTYDGQEKVISLLDLPSSITAVYSGNKATAAGEYIARADLYYVDTINYNPLASVYVTWRVNKANINLEDVVWNYLSPFSYDGNVHTVTLDNLPSGVGVNYTNNSKSGVGTYTATAEFVYDTDNYNLINNNVASLEWEII